jgi:peptidoglycan/LPS O-acetylase OafA/YrhL
VQYRPDIDGLRAVAVLAVVAHHAFPDLLPGGFVGVDIFFVISGYLITRDILERQAAGTFTLADFYRRRVRRIFPALVVVLAATLLAGSLLLFKDEFERLIRHTLASALFAQNFVLLGESGYFAPAAQLLPLLHLWSLAVEEQFYLVWPLLLGLGLRLRWTQAMMVSSFVLLLWLVAEAPAAAYYLPLSRFWQIMAGAALAISGRQFPILSLPGAALCGLGIAFASPSTGDLPLSALVPTVGAACVIAAGSNRWLTSRWLVFVGLVSYPLYLWHWPILAFLRTIVPAPTVAQIAVAIAASLVLAVLTYWLIERPIRAARRRVFPLALAMMGVVAVSSVGAMTGDPRPAAKVLASQMDDLKFREPTGFAECDPRIHAFGLTVRECMRDGKAKVVLGDSHAETMFAALAAIQPGRWSLVSRPACAPGASGLACSSLNAAVPLVASDPAVEVVLFAFRSNADLAGIERSVAALRGKRVVMLISPPELPFRVRYCVPRPMAPAIDCTLDRKAAEVKQLALRAGLAGIAQRHGAELVDAMDSLCGSTACEVVRGDMLAYRDDNHLSLRGAGIVARQVIAAMASRG